MHTFLKERYTSATRQHTTPSTAGRLAVILLGHGTLHLDGGAAMIKLAERAQAVGLAPLVTASFLNYCRPSFAEALARCIDADATQVVVQPYFLVAGKYVHDDLSRLIETSRMAHPELLFRAARPLGDHPALARLLLKRAIEADYLFANPQIALSNGPRPLAEGASWQPLHMSHHTGLLIVAHGTPDGRANLPVQSMAHQVRMNGRYAMVAECYLGLNQPNIATAITALVRNGMTHIIVAPYFLHLGNHVREDIPLQIAAARTAHPRCQIILAEYLGYDRLLVGVIADRISEALHESTTFLGE